LVVMLMLGSVIMVNAAELLPYEENIKTATLITYGGENKQYWTRKILGNTSIIHKVLDVIDDKEEVEKTVGSSKGLTNLQLKYKNSEKTVLIIFYEENLIGVTEDDGEEKIYEVNYNGSSENAIIDLYSFIVIEGDKTVKNPSTSDNLYVIIPLAIATAGLMVVSYRKKQHN